MSLNGYIKISMVIRMVPYIILLGIYRGFGYLASYKGDANSFAYLTVACLYLLIALIVIYLFLMGYILSEDSNVPMLYRLSLFKDNEFYTPSKWQGEINYELKKYNYIVAAISVIVFVLIVDSSSMPIILSDDQLFRSLTQELVYVFSAVSSIYVSSIIGKEFQSMYLCHIILTKF